MAGKFKKRKKKKNAFASAVGNLFPVQGDGVLESIRKIVFLLSVAVFAVCAYLVFEYFYENYENRQIYGEIAGIYNQDAVQENNPDNEIKLLPGAENLLAVNEDTVGYIEIPGTVVNYPIVQRKSEREAQYYLHINFMNQETKAGALFLDWRCNFNYELQSDNLVIYGHDMKDGSMFGTLRNYKKDDYISYYQQHPIIKLNSNYEEGKYKIFGCFISDADISRGDVFEYYNKIEFASEEEFYYFVNDVKRRTLILNDVDVKYGDKLVTLSTCSQEFSNSRFVVMARKLREGESEKEGIENSRKNPNPLMPDIWYTIRVHESYDPNAEFIPYG